MNSVKTDCPIPTFGVPIGTEKPFLIKTWSVDKAASAKKEAFACICAEPLPENNKWGLYSKNPFNVGLVSLEKPPR